MPSARHAMACSGETVGRSVVGDDPLDGDAVAWRRTRSRGAGRRPRWWLSRRGALRRRPGGWRHRSRRARRPSRLHARHASGIGRARTRVAFAAGDALACAAVDAPELLDVDVDQLARSLALIAHRGLQPEPAELAHPEPLAGPPQIVEHRQPEQIGELGGGEPQPAQRGEHPTRSADRCGCPPAWAPRTIQQPRRPSARQRATHFAAVRWLTPAASAAARTGQPSALHSIDQQPPAVQTERAR